MYTRPKVHFFAFQLVAASCGASQGLVSLISSQVTCMGAVLQLHLTVLNVHMTLINLTDTMRERCQVQISLNYDSLYVKLRQTSSTVLEMGPLFLRGGRRSGAYEGMRKTFHKL